MTTPDRTDAVARVLTVYEQAHEESGAEAWPEADDYARAILTTDDPAAVAAIAREWWERHPDQYLTVGRDAGVLSEETGWGLDDLNAYTTEREQRQAAAARIRAEAERLRAEADALESPR